MSNEFDVDSITRFLRNTLAKNYTIAYSPNIDDDTEVINIETIPHIPGRLVLDCDNGKTICLDISVYDTDI